MNNPSIKFCRVFFLREGYLALYVLLCVRVDVCAYGLHCAVGFLCVFCSIRTGVCFVRILIIIIPYCIVHCLTQTGVCIFPIAHAVLGTSSVVNTCQDELKGGGICMGYKKYEVMVN